MSRTLSEDDVRAMHDHSAACGSMDYTARQTGLVCRGCGAVVIDKPIVFKPPAHIVEGSAQGARAQTKGGPL